MLTPMSRGARTLGCVVLLGCGSTPSRVPETQSGKAEAPRAAACSSVSNDAKHLVAVGHQGSAVALARSGDRLLAYVANREAKRLDVVDVKARSAIGTIALQGSPEQVLVLADGRLVVSLEDRAALETLSIGANFLSFSPERECLIDVPGRFVWNAWTNPEPLKQWFTPAP